MSCDFKVPIGIDEVIDILVSVVNVGNTSARLGYTAKKENGAIAAMGSMAFVTVSLETGLPVAIPTDLRKVLEQAE